MAYLEFHNLQLYYEEHGEGKPLVFLHGLGADLRQIVSLMSELKGYRIITMDMPAHGNSLLEDHQSDLSFNFFGDAVVALMNHLGLGQCMMGGISMGSGITLNVALRDPSKISGLILVRPSWLDQKQPDHLSIVGEIGHWIEDHGVEEAGKHLLQHDEYQEINNNYPMAAQSLQAVLTRPQAVSGASVLYKMYEDRPFESLKQLSALTQKAIVCGNDGDDLHPVSISQQIKEALPNAYYHHLPERYVDPEAYRYALLEQIEKF